MLAAGGLPVTTDNVRTADEDNPKGYFEDERVKALESAEDKAWVRSCRGKVVKVISFLLKDLPAENAYKVIFMRRDLDEVLASQNKMLERRGEVADAAGNEALRGRYAFHLKKVAYLLETEPNYDALEIEYGEVLREPRAGAERVRRFLGLNLDVERMVAAVEPSLYRNRASQERSR